MAKAKRESKREHFWRQHISQHHASGLSVRAYCQQHQLGEASFYSWRRTLAKRERAALPTVPPAFVPVVVTGQTTHTTTDIPLELQWPDGRCLRIRASCERTLLAAVLAVLEGHGC